MKKILLLATAVVLCISIHSCVEKDVETPDDTTQTGGDGNSGGGGGIGITINPWTDHIDTVDFELTSPNYK